MEPPLTPDPADEIVRLNGMIEEYKDEYLRAKAEMENVRRRSENEISNARKFGVERFARELLDVRDSLDQAAAVDLSGENSEVVSKMQGGPGADPQADGQSV